MIEHALDCDEHDFTQCPNFKRLVENLAEGGRLPADHAVRSFRRTTATNLLPSGRSTPG
jgi:hypothetical protein